MYQTVSAPPPATDADTLALALTNLRKVSVVLSGSRNHRTGFDMTKTKRVLLASGALALGAAAFTGASLADGWGRHHGGHGGGAMFLFEQFDTNQDGRLTQAEIDQARDSAVAPAQP